MDEIIKIARINVKKILDYCNHIKANIDRFGDDYEIYYRDFAYRSSCDMCLLQIGELAAKLPAEIREKYSEVRWKGLIGMRSVYLNNYERCSERVTWNTLQTEIPILKGQCFRILRENFPEAKYN